MTRTERIQKLARAIKDYRGSYVPNLTTNRVIWIRHPQPKAKERILKWLNELHVKDTAAAMTSIDGFYDCTAMHDWLDELESQNHGK